MMKKCGFFVFNASLQYLNFVNMYWSVMYNIHLLSDQIEYWYIFAKI